MREHLSLLTDSYIRQGTTPEEAIRVARRQFGNTTSLLENRRDMQTIPTLESLWRDVCHGGRMLRKNPGLTTVALLTLSLGIGANAAIFSVVNAVLLRPLGFAEPDRLVTFWGSAPEMGLPTFSYPDAIYAYYRTHSHVLDPIAAYSGFGSTLTGQGEAERLNGAAVSSNFFRLLGRSPQEGRTFLPEEEARDRNHVAVLSHGLWQRRFGADRAL
jgi:hypothetical protein